MSSDPFNVAMKAVMELFKCSEAYLPGLGFIIITISQKYFHSNKLS